VAGGGLPANPFEGPVPPGGWDRPPGHAPRPPKPDSGRLAGWGARFAAQLIDWLVILIPGSIVGFLLVAWLAGNGETVDFLYAVGATALFIVGGLFVALFYGPVLMRRPGRHNGQTWGKQLLGITVTRDSGEPFGFWSAALREIGLKGVAVGVACIVVPVIPFFLDYLWPLWDGENRAIHDMAAETHVVRV
jgi:uncharacterized RDD family membrane protein YckC